MHPHPDKAHLMRTYRRHIMSCKKRWGSARGLIHYRRMLNEYLECKRIVLTQCDAACE